MMSQLVQGGAISSSHKRSWWPGQDEVEEMESGPIQSKF
jgi:hypothetical protein